jgi:hypothetical protein
VEVEDLLDRALVGVLGRVERDERESADEDDNGGEAEGSDA